MLGIELRRSGTLPLKRQIYLQIKNRILSGTLKSGEALPSTRAFSAEYEISRNTVSEAYEMLATEGFILCRQGAPVRVSDGLELAETTPVPVKPEKQDFTIAADFRTGRPDLRAFPRYLWQQLVNKAVLETPAEQLGYSDPAGLPMLRSEIAAWLYRSRGLTVDPGDLFITAGATHALFLAAELLCRRDDAMAIEDPCHTGMLRTLEHTGCRIIPVPVDDSGMQVPDFSRDKRIRALYVTPSHQFPLGSIMPAARRTALLRLAILNDTIIIEDDYDSEFRYCGEPIAPLYAMDPQRVLYIGTFSKTVFPALRIGFAILPRALQKSWTGLRTHTDVQNPILEQKTLALFLRERKMDRHVKKMRSLYAERRTALLEALTDFIERPVICGDAAGLHLAASFPGKTFDDAFTKIALANNIRIASVEKHCIIKGRHESKLLLGFGHLNREEINTGVYLLRKLISG